MPADTPVVPATTINDRFLLVLDQLGLSGYAVGRDGPVSAATITNIRNGSQRPGIDLVLWLVETYPQVNPSFLLLGEGMPLCRYGTTIYNQGTGNVYNYKSKTRAGVEVKELEHLRERINGLSRENALLQELLTAYRQQNGQVMVDVTDLSATHSSKSV